MKTEFLRVILCANGKGTRFAATDGPKVLAPVDGEPLLHRTIRQIAAILDPKFGIHVVATDKRMVIPPAELIAPAVTWNPLPGYCFGESAAAFDPAGQLDHLVLMGDIYWPDSALADLLRLKDDAIEILGHFKARPCKNPEIHGVHVPAPCITEWFDALYYVDHHRIHPTSCGWLVYRHLHEIPPEEHLEAGGFFETAPEVTDIDIPQDYTEVKALCRAEKRRTKEKNHETPGIQESAT